MVTLLLYLVLSVIHLAVKNEQKRKKAGALSLLYSQLSGRHTLLIYLIFVGHKGGFWKVLGGKYEAYVQSVFSVINKVTEAEKSYNELSQNLNSHLLPFICIQAENHHGK